MNSEKATSTTQQLLAQLTETFPRSIAARLWDGSVWQSREDGPACFTLVLQHPGAARAMFWPFGNLHFGESYIFDDFDIEGDTLAFADWLAQLMTTPKQFAPLDQFRFLFKLLSLPSQKNPRDRAHAGRPTSEKATCPTTAVPSNTHTTDPPNCTASSWTRTYSTRVDTLPIPTRISMPLKKENWTTSAVNFASNLVSDSWTLVAAGAAC